MIWYSVFLMETSPYGFYAFYPHNVSYLPFLLHRLGPPTE